MHVLTLRATTETSNPGQSRRGHRVRAVLRWPGWPFLTSGLSSVGFVASIAVAFYVFRGFAFRLLAQPLSFFDEPMQLVGGMFVNLGQKPLVDFRSVYPPLNYYAAALVFRLMGTSVVAFRLYEIAMLAVAIGCVGWLGFRRGLGLGSVGLVLLGASVLSGGTVETVTTPAIALVLLSLVFYGEFLRQEPGRKKTVSACLAGLMLSAAMFCRLNFGLYLGVAMACERAVTFFHGYRNGAGLRAIRALLPLAVTFCLGLTLVAFTWRGHLASCIDQFITAPSRALYRYSWAVGLDYGTSVGRNEILRQGFFLPMLPGLWLTARTLGGTARGRIYPCVVGLATAIVAIVLSKRWGLEAPLRLPMVAFIGTLPLFAVALTHRILRGLELVVVGTVGLSSHYFLSRPDLLHFCSLLPILAALLAFAVPRVLKLRQLIPVLLAYLVFSPIATERWQTVDSTSVGLGREMWKARASFLSKGDVVTASLPQEPLAHHLFHGAAAVPGPPVDDERQALGFALAGLPPNAPIYVGMQDHVTHTVVNDVRAYWLAGRRTAVRDIMLMNGLTTPPAAERRIIEDLETSRVPRVVLWKGFPLSPDWGLHVVVDSDGGLDRFIRATYHRLATFGEFEVWERNADLPRPSALNSPPPAP